MPQVIQAKAGRTGVFISYSHKDHTFLEGLRPFLRRHESAGSFQYFDDTRIEAGMDWRAEIRRGLDSAKVAILLISADFLVSKFISENELPLLLDAAEEAGTIILPLIVGRSDFAELKSLSRFQPINDPNRPLKELKTAQREKIYKEVADRVRTALAIPGTIELPATAQQVSDPRVEAARRKSAEAQSASDEKTAQQGHAQAWPGGHQDRWRWDRFTLRMTREVVLKLNAEHDDNRRRGLLCSATVVNDFGSALVHFGYAAHASNITFKNLVDRWDTVVKSEPHTRTGWVDFICDEMYRAIHNIPAWPRWEPMKSPQYPRDWFYPILNHARILPDGGFEFDIYMYRLPGALPYVALVPNSDSD